MRLITVGIGFGALTAIASPCVAQTAARAPAAVASPLTGFYVGANIGYGTGLSDPIFSTQAYGGNLGKGSPYASSVPATPNAGPTGGGFPVYDNRGGVLGGAQAGYSIALTPLLVAGIEADFQGAGISGAGVGAQYVNGGFNNLAPKLSTLQTTRSLDWFGTLRGRIGTTFLDQQLLAYATGGFAYGRVRANIQAIDIYQGVGAVYGASMTASTRTGYSIGAGVEYAPVDWRGWSVKAEYLFVDFGATSAGLSVSTPVGAPSPAPNVGAVLQSRERFHIFRVGANYRFDFLR